jgi:rSAM/selenodomain-associated transferase 1
MRNEHIIAVIIPVLNEETVIGNVIRDIPAWVDEIVVVDRGSVDDTARVAADQGARVVSSSDPGYGAACLRGLEALHAPDIVVFLDGDYSAHPEEMPLLVDPVIHGEVDFMVGSREPGALTRQVAFQNWLATKLIRVFWGIRYTDLGSFRAIRYRTLCQLGMVARDQRWLVEMQIKAALHVVPADEVPVSWREGHSKGSSTGAGANIFGTILLHALFSKYSLKTGLLIYFTQFPEPGTSKPHLIDTLGAEGAADFQRAMTEHVLAHSIPPLTEVETQIRYTGADRGALRAWLGPEHLYVRQGEGDLGERMARALDEGLRQAYGKVVLCGCDCPGMTRRHTQEAFGSLDGADLVVGPSADGGVYLIGLSLHGAPEEISTLFDGVEWETDTVRESMLANAERIGLSVGLLEELPVVHGAEELIHWEKARAGGVPGD